MKSSLRTGRRFLPAVIAVLLAGLSGGSASSAGTSHRDRSNSPRRIFITLLSTTDLHGHIYPEDDVTGAPADLGLAKIATLVRQMRHDHANTLLLDCGDTIQGSALAYVAARRSGSKPNPMIAAMNALGYTAMAFGNHEFNFGLDLLARVRREAKFPFLAANLRAKGTDNPLQAKPYVIRQVAGVRVGIVGFVTPGVPRWELPENYAGYDFAPIVDVARQVIPEVRAKSDLLVVIAHSGLERDPDTGTPWDADPDSGENAIWALANQVPGIDVILFGHTHKELSGKTLNGVLLAQAKNWGRSLAVVNVEMQSREGGGWRLASKDSSTIPVTSAVVADPKILLLTQPAERATQAWLAQPVARVAAELDGATGRVEDHPLVGLIHSAQLEAGHADVSLATMFNPGVRFPAGAITARQIFALYPYENVLFTVAMTGAQLRDALEHAAGMFPAWPCEPCSRGAQLPLPGFSADSAGGVSYTLDLSAPRGSRVRDLNFSGRPLESSRKLRVAVNHYRYYGGGGYRVLRGLPILERSRRGVRDLILEYLETHPAIAAASPRNWRIEPREAQEALLEEARRPWVSSLRPQNAGAPWIETAAAQDFPGTGLEIFTFQADKSVDTPKPSCYFSSRIEFRKDGRPDTRNRR